MKLIKELENAKEEVFNNALESGNIGDMFTMGMHQGLKDAIDMAEEYQAWLETEIENEIHKNKDNADYCKGLQKALEIMKGK